MLFITSPKHVHGVYKTIKFSLFGVTAIVNLGEEENTHIILFWSSAQVTDCWLLFQ